MATRLIHATHEGSHLYKFEIGIGDIKRLRADGVPVDTEWLSPRAYGQVDHFFTFDHEVKDWTMVKEIHHGSFVRNEKESPFKMELPPVFEEGDCILEWGIKYGLVEFDEEGEPKTNSLRPFYDWVSNDEPEEAPYEFEVRDIGEITPCPKVPFSWEPLQPHESMVPSEMWHMGPVQIKRDTLRDLFWKWVDRNKEELHVDVMFRSSQDGTIYFKAGDVKSHIDVLKDSDFLALLGVVTGKDLDDLQAEFDLRMKSLQDLMVSCSPTHQCPKCDGAGALPCPRCGGVGVTDKGKQAQTALRDALSKVRQIKGSRGDDALRSALWAVENLEKFFLPGEVKE